MRNYLLASAAVLGLVAAGAAHAATFAPSDPSKNSSAFGAPQTKPDPGKIIVHMGGLVAVDAAAGSQTTDKSNSGAKNSPYGLTGYFRLYFGFDGKLTNGLIYGAKSEMRTNFASTVAFPSGGSTNSTWYTRRAYGYVGGDSWGIIRMGQTDGPITLFTGGGITTGEAYDTGQWDGDVCDFTSMCLAWGFNDIGNIYTSNKIAWVSPSWGGLNVGLSYAPSTANLYANGNSPAAANAGSAAVSTAISSADTKRPKDMYEVAARWQGNLGPVAVDAMLGYEGSGLVKPATGVGYPAGVSGYKDLSVYDGGLSLTYMGASLFGHVTGGQYDGPGIPVATVAGHSRKNGLAWTIGAQYTNGPWTVGTSWYQFDHNANGLTAAPSFRKERGFDIGGNYNVVPGFDLFLSYLWGEIKQTGVDLRDGGYGPNHNSITASVVQATALFRW